MPIQYTDKPLISIIIPSFNCAEYLPKAIDSVLNQTYQDFEIIIVDDGSTDNTKDILKSYIEKGKIIYIYQENKGLPASRNTGIKSAKGKYIAILDGDDELVPEALEECLSAIENNNAEWCISNLLRVEDNKSEVKVSKVPRDNYFVNILKDDFIRMAPFFKKDALFEIGFYDEILRIREDWDLNIRLIKSGQEFVYINKPLYVYKIRKKSLIKDNRTNVLYFTIKLLQKHHKKLADAGDKEVAKIYSEHMWNLARIYFYESGDIKKAIYCIKESIRYEFNLRRIFHPIFFKVRKIVTQ